MDAGRQLRFWLAGGAAFLVLLWLLRDMLLPFAAGLAVAYFFDPVVDRVQRWGASRAIATTFVVGMFTVVAAAALLAIAPLIVEQATAFAGKLPEYTARLIARLQPLIEPLQERFGVDAGSIADVEKAVAARAGEILQFLGRVLGGLLTQGFALVSVLALLFLTPVVAFYLLRDWDLIIAKVDAWLPVAHAPVLRELAGKADAAIAGYVRGQAMVCLCLAIFYSVGLMVVGLDFGLVIGLIAGAISFIPFVGTWVGGFMAIGMALAQFPPDWVGVGKVVAVFAIGQVLEGNVLAPKLVGDSVGLHPVWIMFALLAGGSLFGFVGVLVAVPVAAVLGVLVRFFLGQYLASTYYTGPRRPQPQPPAEPPAA